MIVWTVRAVIVLETPSGELKKNVNWSCYEERASLTTSTTASEAFNRFLINAPRIINASKSALQYLKSIYFYESSDKKRVRGNFMEPTNIIEVDEEMKLKVIK